MLKGSVKKRRDITASSGVGQDCTVFWLLQP